MNEPATLDRDGIAARIPHAGSMCLLDALLSWDAEHVRCRATGHTDPAHPLRVAQGLLAPVAIEYASQAMALHGALTAGGIAQVPGYLSSLRGVRMDAERLDDIADPLTVDAQALVAESRGFIYRFAVAAAGRMLLSGQATIVIPEDPA